MSNSQDRDQKQRAFGCISFSMLAHVGLLGLLALAPRVAQEFGIPDGTGGDSTTMMDLEMPGAADPAASLASTSAATQEASGPHEILLADSNDPNAVALPNAKEPEVKPEPVTAKVETQAEPQPVEVPKVETVKVEPKPIVVAKAEVQKPEVKPEPVVEKKPEPAPKKAAPKPVAKAVKAKPVVAKPAAKVAAPVVTETSDVAVETNEMTDEEVDAAAEQEKADLEQAAPVKPVAQRQEPVEAPQPREEAAYPGADHQEMAEALNEAPQQAPAPAPAPQAPQYAQRSDSMGNAQGAARIAAPGATGQGQNGQAPNGPAGGNGTPVGMQVRDSSLLVPRPGNPRPPYPDQDRLNRREGTVVMLAQIMSDGSVGSVVIERSSGSQSLDASAVNTYRRWKYNPGQAGYVRHPFTFQLTGEAQPYRAQQVRQSQSGY